MPADCRSARRVPRRHRRPAGAATPSAPQPGEPDATGRRRRCDADRRRPSPARAVLAAVERAQRHRRAARRGAARCGRVLDASRAAARARRGAGRAGAARRARASGSRWPAGARARTVWSRSRPRGAGDCGARARRASQELPESPQRRRVAARPHRGRAGARRASALARSGARSSGARGCSRHDGRPDSDAWLALGERSRAACRRLGSAWHCLHEWPEPDDERADGDGAPSRAMRAEPRARPLRALRAGRRNVRLWREPRLGERRRRRRSRANSRSANSPAGCARPRRDELRRRLVEQLERRQRARRRRGGSTIGAASAANVRSAAVKRLAEQVRTAVGEQARRPSRTRRHTMRLVLDLDARADLQRAAR